MIRYLCALLLLPWVAENCAAQVVKVGRSYAIHSAVLNEDREYNVHLPASYGWAKDRRYPVLYVLDGQSHLVHTATSVEFLAATGEIPEMIVVGITSTVRIRDFTQTDWPSMWVGGGGANNFKQFLSTEFIPRIDSAYRTDGFRVLSGHSASGQFVLYCLASEPSLFKAYIALSPSLDWDDALPIRSLQKSFASTDSLPAFLYVARSDDSGRPLADYERLVEVLQTGSPPGLRWHGEAFPQETHMSIALLAQIDALRHVYEGYRFHDDLAGKGLAFVERHFEEVSKRVGWPIAIPEGVINDLGYAALSEGRTQDAIALFHRNVRSNPNSARAYDSLADGHAEAEQWKDAAEASNRAVALATEFGDPDLTYFIEQARKMNEHLQRGAGDHK
jgi:predicted alpha/beta superfamily hydrolase